MYHASFTLLSYLFFLVITKFFCHPRDNSLWHIYYLLHCKMRTYKSFVNYDCKAVIMTITVA